MPMRYWLKGITDVIGVAVSSIVVCQPHLPVIIMVGGSNLYSLCKKHEISEGIYLIEAHVIQKHGSAYIPQFIM